MYLGLVLACLLLLAGCGGGDEGDVTPTPAPTPAPSSPSVGEGQAETTEDAPFVLNTDQPVPPDFELAYERGARIVVQFYKLDEDSLSYPQGLAVDRQVSRNMERLSRRYSTIEFFSYQITDPGPVGEDLQADEYGTLAAQLGVGITPFVVMLAPNGDEYVVTNLYQGYTPEPVLSQALFDLAAVEVDDNTSDVNVRLDQVQVTDKGGDIEFITVSNGGSTPANLQNFSIRVLDPESGDVMPGVPGLTIDEDIEVMPGESVSIGRVRSVVDDEGKRVEGTFAGGGSLDLAPGDQIALLDAGGAVASMITI